MDTKRLVGPILIMMGLVFLWKLAVLPYLEAHYPELAKENQPIPESTTAPSVNTNTGVASNTTNPTTSTSAVATTGHGFDVIGGGSAKTAELGSVTHNDPTYALGMMIDPMGAGLSSVTLNRYFQTDQQTDLYTFQKPLSDDSTTRALATQSVTVDGNVVDLSNVNWSQEKADSTTATYVATVREAGEPVLELRKVFEVFPANDKPDGPDGFEVRVQQDFRNLTNRAINVKVKFNGTVPPAGENERSEDRQFLTGYDDGFSEVKVEHTLVNELSKSKPTKDLIVDKTPLLWAGSGNSYFNAIIRPEYAGTNVTPLVKIAALTASARNLGASRWQDQGASFVVETNEFKLDPQADAPMNLRVFLGPKQRELLKNAYYSAFPMHYDNTLVITSSFCGFLTFGWLINILYGILWCFHWVFRDWGLAIIGLVCLVRLLLHPITKKSQVNMMQMGKMGPEIERLKKKYGDDKDGLNKAMMGVYKDQGLTPILGCLPMLLQTPIWIALWSALQSTFELRQAPFLFLNFWHIHLHLTWIKDLSEPDKLFSFGHDIPLLFFSISALNILPLFLAVVSYIQTKLQPVPATQTPEQAQQRKMMMWMGPLLFPIMLYKGPSGLNLYILTSSTIGIFENKIIRKHIKDKEEAEKAGRIIVDAKPTRASKRSKDNKKKDEPPKKGGMMGWLAELQAKADQVRREAEKRKT